LELLLSLELSVLSFPFLSLRDSFKVNAVSPPVETAPATTNPIVDKQKGHIASPLGRVAKRDR
jgi:hypothetical protein